MGPHFPSSHKLDFTDMAKFLRRASAIIVCLQISMTYVFAAPLETPGFSHHCEKVTCNSDSWGNKTCTHELPVNTLKCEVKLLRKDSLISGCELDQDYGVSPDCKNMWVDNGCRGEFELCIERGCPDGYFSLLFGSSGSCFKAEDPLVEVDIENARSACAADGAELISAPSMEEFEALRAWMIKELPSGTDIWVSMKWSGSDDSETQWNMGKHYTWADGTPAQDQMWAADEPSAPLYVAFRGDKDYRLENRAVNKKASYMCEKKLL